MEKLTIATRSSPLALWQARFVADLLNAQGIETRIKAIETIGDKKLDVSISKIGSKGVFTQELEEMLISGEAHFAVHSAKDMPSRLQEGLEIIAFTKREIADDVLISPISEFDLNRQNILVGTASTRRVAILKRYFPDVRTVAIRGNLQTRIRKMNEGQCDALLLAYAGVQRMGFDNLIQRHLPVSVFTPAVGQGTLAIEVSTDLPEPIKNRLKLVLNDEKTSIALAAERSFLRTMDGGCSVPVFGYASFENDGFRFSGGVVSLNGQDEIRISETSGIEGLDQTRAAELGHKIALRILEAGGDEILSKIKQNLRSK